MPRKYPNEFRRKVLDLVEAGRPVAEIADQPGVTGQRNSNWRKQDLIDRGLRAGVPTSESIELREARRRIHELETELAVTKRANELLKGQTDPEGDGRWPSSRERGSPRRGRPPTRLHGRTSDQAAARSPRQCMATSFTGSHTLNSPHSALKPRRPDFSTQTSELIASKP